MKRALVLSGGGNKGAFEAGAVYHLIQTQNYHFDIFSGTSVGALNAGYLAQGGNLREQGDGIETLKERWLSIRGNRDIFSFRLINIFKMLWGGALYQPVGLQEIIESLIIPERLKAGKPLLIPCVALEDGELFLADSRRDEDRNEMARFLLASASMPVYFPPVQIRGKHWVDGGLRNITPLNAVLSEWPNEIVVVTTYPVTPSLEPVFPKFSRVKNIMAVIHRVIDILTAEIASGDLQVAQKIAGQNRRVLQNRIRLTIVAPDAPLEDHCLEFSPKLLQKYFTMGIRAAQKLRVYD